MAPMIWAKLLLIGIGSAVLSAALWIVVAVLPVSLPSTVTRARGESGFSSRYINSDWILIAALAGFLVASLFAWTWLWVA